MTKHRKTYSPDERRAYAEAKRAEATERFDAALADLFTSEGFVRWVEARARFHNYSWGNVLLIVSQMPTATRCASYRTWGELGRQVRKGEKGLWIRVPTPVKVKVEDSQTGEESERRIMRFKGGYTFDVSQTDGDPLPEGPDAEPLTGDSHAHLLPALEEYAATLGYTVESRDLTAMSAGGWCDSTKQLIVIDSSESPNMQVHTLAHEIAHALGISYRDFGRAEAEVIVEAAAYIALSVCGLDASCFAVGYVAGWSHGDLAKVKAVASTVDDIAKKLGEVLGVQSGDKELMLATA